MTYISMCPKVICEENCEGAEGPRAGIRPKENILHSEPEKQFLMHIFWAKDD